MSYKPGEACYFDRLPPQQLQEVWGKPWLKTSVEDYVCAAACLSEAGAFIQLLPSLPAHVVEMGCFDGWLCHCLCLAGYNTTGVDICETAIEEAWNRSVTWRRTESNPQFVCADYDSVELFKPIDAVVFNNSLHHSLDQYSTLSHAYKLIRSGGMLIVNEPGLGHRTKQAVEWERIHDVTERSTPPYRVMSMAKSIGFVSPRVYPSPGTMFKSVYAQDGLFHHKLLKSVSRLMGCIPVVLFKYLHGLVTMNKP